MNLKDNKIIIILCILRIIISIILTKSSFADDEMIYLAIIKNIIVEGKFLVNSPDGLIFHDYQWFTPVFYLPFYSLIENKIIISIVNNISFIIVVLLLSKIWGINRLGKTERNIFFILFLLYPPMYEINILMLTENVFIFLLFILIYLIFKDINDIKNRHLYYILLLFSIICFVNTRPVSFIYLIVFIIITIYHKKYFHLIVIILAIIFALLINRTVKDISVGNNQHDENMAITTLYFTNTIYSDGSTDNYMKKMHYLNDTVFSSYLNKDINNIQLIDNLIKQIWNNPAVYFKITGYKLINYFYRIWPSVWNYPNEQNIIKRIYEYIFNSIIYIFIIFGITKSRIDFIVPKFYKSFFVLIFLLSLIFHLLFLSRYRYIIPVILIGLPFVYISVLNLKENYKNYFIKKQI